MEENIDEKISNIQLINLIYSIINWEHDKENLFNHKDNNKEINYFLISKEYYSKLKQIINCQKIISDIDNRIFASNKEIDIKNIIDEHIKNNIIEQNKNEIKILNDEEKNLNEDLIIKELIENQNFIVEIINEDIKKNMNLKEKEFLELKYNYIDENIYFTNENNFSNKKLIIMFLLDLGTLYEIIFIVDDCNYKALIEILKEENNNILNKYGINIKEINENNIIKNIKSSNFDFYLFITIISKFK